MTHPPAKPTGPDGAPSRWRRRAMLAGGLAAVALWVGLAPRIPELFRPRFRFKPVEGLAPFRELDEVGDVSAPNPLLLGINEQGGQGDTAAGWRDQIVAVRAAPCPALFRTRAKGAVPVAFFTDVNCPNCRVLEADLAAYALANPGAIVLTRHELPLLGPSSVLAARVILAAGQQGASERMQQRLRRARLSPDAATLSALAGGLGLDAARFLRDMNGPQVQTRLDRDRALAEIFGFYATPGAVVGRTAFLGAIPADDIAALIELEAGQPPLSCSDG